MKRNKGQALVEFILILPVFLLLIMGLIDISGLLYQKFVLENNLNTAVELYQQNNITELNRYLGEKKYAIETTKIDKKTTLTLRYQQKIQTPVLKQMLGSSYTLETSRVFYEK